MNHTFGGRAGAVHTSSTERRQNWALHPPIRLAIPRVVWMANGERRCSQRLSRNAATHRLIHTMGISLWSKTEYG